MNILGFYKDHIKQKLSSSQVITFRELVENLMSQNRHELLYYKRRLKAMNTVVN